MTADIAKLFRIEKNKLLPYKAFNVLMILYTALFVLCVVFFSSLFFNNVWSAEEVSRRFSQNFHTNVVWNGITYFAGYFNFFLSFAVIMYTCNEYTYRTLRQNIIDGLSPEETVLSKLIIILILATAATVLVALMALYVELKMNGGFILPIGLQYLGLYFLQLLSSLIMAFFFGTVFRKTGVAIMVFAAWWYLLDGLLLYYAVLPNEIAVYLPASNLKDMVHFPGLDEAMAQDVLNPDKMGAEARKWMDIFLSPNYLRNVITAIAWSGIFIFLSFRMVKKRDL